MVSLTPSQRVYLSELNKRIGGRPAPAAQIAAMSLWRPDTENFPQQRAYELARIVDEFYYGGGAGGGKTDLALGLAITQHRRSLFLRREIAQLKKVNGAIDRSKEILMGNASWNGTEMVWRDIPGDRQIEFGGCEHEQDKFDWMGRPHDYIEFDEGTNFSETQFLFITGWNRTVIPGQHCLVTITSNPPMTTEGEWIIERYGPWLNSEHPNPAQPGEIRWFVRIKDKDTEVEKAEIRFSVRIEDKDIPAQGPEPVLHKGEMHYPRALPLMRDGELLYPKSRTFIPALHTDNSYITEDYTGQLQGMPEPLRSQLLLGNFQAGRTEDPWQVIPSAWIKAAQARWTPEPPANSFLSAVGVDVARGGKDKTVIAPRRGHWIGPLKKYPGEKTPSGPKVAALVLAVIEDNTAVNIDVGGVGSSPYDSLRERKVPLLSGVNNSHKSEAKDRGGQLGFYNKRAELAWKMRERLDPEKGDNIALPPDPEILADLSAPKWSLTPRGIKVELKEDIIKRLKRSPDCGDAVILAFAQSAQAEIQMVTGATSKPSETW